MAVQQTIKNPLSRLTADSVVRSGPHRAGIVPSGFGLVLENLTVHRASRSLCASLPGLAFQVSGICPRLIAFFSSSLSEKLDRPREHRP